MSRSFPLPTSPPTSATEAIPCRQCGGSGKLRVSEDHIRTCLDCLGEGRQRPGELLLLPTVSAAVAASAAR